MKRKWLLLDLDGTLLGSAKLPLHLGFAFYFVSGLRAYGLSSLQGLRVLHQLKKAMSASSHQKDGIPNWSKATRFFSNLSGLSEEQGQNILPELAKHCFQKCHFAFFSVPEAQRFVEWASEHFLLVLATNPLWPLEVVQYRLGLAGISENVFEFITHAGNMSSIKPHFSYYSELQEKKQLPSAECLMVGNDVAKDGPAEKVGIEVFIVRKPSDFKILQEKLILEGSFSEAARIL
jgi:FMN phosphatase YigB (HAD superfamily)